MFLNNRLKMLQMHQQIVESFVAAMMIAQWVLNRKRYRHTVKMSVRRVSDEIEEYIDLSMHGISQMENEALYKDADETSVLTTINAKLAEYKNQLSAKLGKSVIKTQIISILNSVYGVFKVVVDIPDDIELQENEWANLVNYEITVGGYANE